MKSYETFSMRRGTQLTSPVNILSIILFYFVEILQRHEEKTWFRHPWTRRYIFSTFFHLVYLFGYFFFRSNQCLLFFLSILFFRFFSFLSFPYIFIWSIVTFLSSSVSIQSKMHTMRQCDSKREISKPVTKMKSQHLHIDYF